MQIVSLTLLPAIIAGSLSPVQGAAAPLALPAPSVWTLNVSASEMGSMPVPRTEELSILVFSERDVRWQLHSVDAQGMAHDFAWEGAADGKPRPVYGEPRENASFTMTSSHVDEPDGSVLDGVTTLSPDGRVWTENATFKPKVGEPTHLRFVYDRVK